MELPQALRAMVEALLIGFLLGAEREASREEAERQPGVRDFILISLVGAVCALLRNPWLTVAALVSIAGLLAVFHFQVRERSGLTTEMAAVAVFCLGFLTAAPDVSFGPTLAIGLTVLVAILLEAKRSLHRFVRETITETEFNDTLRFLAIIFIIYPILPEGGYGPYRFFVPRNVWLFVILVSSVSYAGYFLEKFLGARAGVRVAGLVGGLASSTAATVSLARSSREQPERAPLYWQATVLANAVQFPRVLAIVYVVNATLGRAGALPLLVMGVTGAALARVAPESRKLELGAPAMAIHNPFQLGPALKFGAIFTVVLFFSKAASAVLGGQAVLGVSAAAGSIDADAAVLSVSNLAGAGGVTLETAQIGVFIALLANAVVKIALAAQAGAAGFALRLAAAFAAMFTSGAAAWWLVRAL